MSACQVIPFRFETREVRTMLIDDQPWFCAADICAVLGYANSRQAIQKNCRAEGVSVRDTPTRGGKQAMTFITEGSLYRLILKSRKEEALRFEDWVCDEVLPSIRRRGRYEDENAQLPKLVSGAIGTTELTTLKGVMADKAKAVPAEKRISFLHTMHRRLHTRFSVPKTSMIQHKDFADACNFVVSYNALEGEFIEADKSGKVDRLDIHYPVECLLDRRPGMLDQYNDSHDTLNIALTDLNHRHESPCEQIMHTLTNAGYDVDAAFWEIRTFRNKAEAFDRALSHLSSVFELPQEYVVKKVGGRAVA